MATTPETPDDSTVDPVPAAPDAAPDAAETAPEGGLFDQITGILGGNLVETAKVEALTVAAQSYAKKKQPTL